MDAGRAFRFRGVVPRTPRSWGAQLWVCRRQVWLGTFTTQFDAAVAYERASLKLGRYFSLNSPSTIRIYEEMRFQRMYRFETILFMIRSKTYSLNFARFLAYEAAMAHYQCLLAVAMSGQQSSVDTGNGVPEARAPVLLFGARIG